MAAQPDSTHVPELIRTVRQARQYAPDPVPDDVIDTLLEVARWTGSSRNTQPWHFVVITDKEQLRRISQLRTPINWVAEAPLGIAIVLDGENAASEAYDEGRVTERLLIAARSLGLGGGVAFYGDADQQAEGKRILGIPAERTLARWSSSATPPRSRIRARMPARWTQGAVRGRQLQPLGPIEGLRPD